jgi:thymidylate synthase (FAD)
LELRLDPHAQKEIRLYAERLLELTRKVAPRCCASFDRHRLGGVSFSREEFAELRRRLETPGEEPALSGKALERFEAKLRPGRRE